MVIISRYLIAIIGLTYALSASAQAINPNLWRTYINKEFGFRISYPNEWKVIPPKGPNVRFSVSPASGPGNCNVVARRKADLRGMSQQQLNQEIEGMALDDASWSEYLGMPRSQFKMIDRHRAKIFNVPAIYGVIEASIETLEGVFLARRLLR